MPSFALQHWQGTRLDALDEMESAHRGVGGTGRGRRYATRQINQGYAVLLASHFQGFCRELYLECVDHLTGGITPIEVQTCCRDALRLNLQLNRGNPNPGNIGSDFGRLGLVFWDEVHGLDPGTRDLHNELEGLNVWRNAIAHQDFSSGKLGARTLRLEHVRSWRRACNRLAVAFDEVARQH